MAAPTLTTDKAYHNVINAWCMVDWANSAFVTMIMAAVLPVYYQSLAGRGLPGNTPTVYWGYTSSIALLIGALLLTQFVGIPFSLLFGRFGRQIGTKRSIVIGLAWYVLISIGGYFMLQAWHFWALAFAVGMVQGGTQALSRSLFGVMAPKAKSAEFFGFYDVSAKFAGILGPALFAVVGAASRLQPAEHRLPGRLFHRRRLAADPR